MIRTRYSSALAAVALLAAAGTAFATPNPNGVNVTPRVFNDCPGSNFQTNLGYPAFVRFSDDNTGCVGFANLHIWRLSEDGGASEAVFNNSDCFRFAATLVLQGTGASGEAGLNISPWWSQDVEGRFNVRLHDGEIAVFGGVLPFYSFTGSHGITYAEGTPIRLEVIYIPNSNTAGDPATIEYIVHYGGNTYSSGALDFGNCNVLEEPVYGCYGILNNARVGGYLQAPNNGSGTPNGSGNTDALWTDIAFEATCPVPTVPATLGRIKASYR